MAELDPRTVRVCIQLICDNVDKKVKVGVRTQRYGPEPGIKVVKVTSRSRYPGQGQGQVCGQGQGIRVEMEIKVDVVVKIKIEHAGLC